MHRIKYLILVLIIIISGCIPSLHPIFTEDTRVIDDRIIGEWIDIVDYDNQCPYPKKWDFQRYTNFEYRYKNLGDYTIYVDNHELDTSITNRLNYDLYSANKKEYYTLNYHHYNALRFPKVQFEKMIVNLTTIRGELYADFYPWISSGSDPYAKIRGTKIGNPFDLNMNRFQSNTIYGHTFAKIIFEDSKMIIKPFDPTYFEKLIKEEKIRLKHEIVNDEIIITASTEELRNFVGKYGSRDELFLEGDILHCNPTSE